MAWFDYIAVKGLDTSLTDEEAASLPPPEPNPADLAPCPPQYFELFSGIRGGASATAEADGAGDTSVSMSEADITGLQNWMTAVNAWMVDEETWLDAARLWSEMPEGVRGDLPAPVPPTLPPLTDFISLPALIARFGPWGMVVWVGLQIVRRIIEAWIEKRMNPGDNADLLEEFQKIREAIEKGLLLGDEALLKTGLLYENGTKSILDQALLFDGGASGANQSIIKDGLLFADTDGKHKGALERGMLWTQDNVTQALLKAGLLFTDAADGKHKGTLDRGLLYTQDNITHGVLKSGLLFTDIFDSKLKGAMERGLLKTMTVMVGDTPVLKTLSLLELIKMSVDDLAFVDAIVDFGAFRCHIRGKMIEY